MAVNEYAATNPKDGTTTFQRVLIERAPDPGNVFAQIADLPITANDEVTLYQDNSGTPTDWYRHRWGVTGGGTYSDYSSGIQGGDSTVRQWLRADIPDKDITTTQIQQWIDQVLVDLYARGMWKPDRATITITAPGGVSAEYYDLPASIRDVFGLEIVSNDTNMRHVAWLGEGQWMQVGRQIRIFAATTSYKYVVHGKAQYQTIGQLANDYFMLAFRMARLRVLQWRLSQRSNFYKAVTFDKVTDINTPDIRAMIQEAQVDIERDIRSLALAEPAVGVGWSA